MSEPSALRQQHEAYMASRARTEAAGERYLAEQQRNAERLNRQIAESLAKLEAVSPKIQLPPALTMRGNINPQRIIAEVPNEYDVTVAEIFGRRRATWIVTARHEAIRRVSIARPDMSLSAIGAALGGRDHTTILSALRRVGAWPRPKP